MTTEYNKVLEACTSLATIVSIQNKINKIYTSTEDSQLKDFLKPALENLIKTQNAAVSRKISNQKVNCNLNVTPFKELADYCNRQISSAKPQWQILAERDGWSK